MNLIVLTFLISQIQYIQSEFTYVEDDPNVPCSIFDTIDLANSVQIENGSYLHEGIIYPPDLVGTYNYVAKNLTYRETVEPHLRGCLCKIKQCVNLCCPKDQYFLKYCRKRENEVNSDIQIYKNDNSEVIADLYQAFKKIVTIPCNSSYNLDVTRYPDDEYRFNEDGSILLVKMKKVFPRNEYCFTPHKVANKTLMNLTPRVCSIVITELSFHVYSFTLFLSVPFLIITIAVYTIVPELRNLHGKSLSCYLLSLTIAYTLLGYLKTADYIQPVPCATTGFIVYYSFMASFFWLSVISFDLWWNFKGTRGVNKLNESKRFTLYSVYSWGLALVFLTIVLVAQNSNLPYRLKPGIGGGSYCYLDGRLWIQLAYFYGPVLIIIAFNIIVFILTAVHIYKAQQEINKTMAMKESSRNFRNDKDNVMLFLRLFIVMGITWVMEIVSWLAGREYDVFFYITDVCNAALGFLIFVLFVLKKRVMKLIVKRSIIFVLWLKTKYRVLRGISTPSQESSKTNCSSISMANLNEDDKSRKTSRTNTR